MKLSSVRNKPFELISRHVKSHQDEREYDDLTRPEQLNVQADHRATEALSMNFVQTIPSQSSIQYLRAEATQHGYSLVTKYARSEPNSPSTSSERTFRDATTGQTRYMIPSVGLLYRKANAGLTNNERTFVVKFSHGWLPIGVRERLCSGTTDNAQ
jgi:hypothetical protein